MNKMMTTQEFAHELAEQLRNNPKDLYAVVERIKNAIVDGNPIDRLTINEILSYMDQELGNFTYIEEAHDFDASITLMQQVHALIDGE